ncbi:MAG TPA: ribose 5-phosphate isomerase B [Acidobacteriota bacterium]|nr:ribose 5-phosphate isomerase B [Acidobacteriota bacterium]
MRISVGSDHAAYELKAKVVERLLELGHEVLDEGTFGPESVDYPDIAAVVARRVQTGEADRGILLCGTGIGMSIAANKFRGIRCAVCHDLQTSILSREHNDANILALSGRHADPALALEMVQVWLETEFLGGRHGRRVDKIRKIEEGSSAVDPVDHV